MIYIIDGYNVAHVQESGSITKGELEDKRQSLIESVVSYIATTGDEAIVVFDSTTAETTECHQVPNTSVTVCFSSASMIADILINKLVQEKLASTQADIRVVSADWEVQKGSLMKGVERMTPRNFLAEIKKFEKKLAICPEKDKMRWKLEHKVDVETLRKLEEMRRGRG
ncbi:MAG: NYN domain-containing protein [Actinobacteria bacterium]|nr:NYN domain-containing protein [Actinomycetota bacterium]